MTEVGLKLVLELASSTVRKAMNYFHHVAHFMQDAKCPNNKYTLISIKIIQFRWLIRRLQYEKESHFELSSQPRSFLRQQRNDFIFLSSEFGQSENGL